MAGSSTVVTTTSDGLAWITVKKAAPAGNVTVSLLTDGTNGSDNFGAGADATITIQFVDNPNPTISSENNKTFTKGAGTTAIPRITITNSPILNSITLGNNIQIRIPASLNCTFDSNVLYNNPNFGGSASGLVAANVTFSGGDKIVIIDVTNNFGINDTLTIGLANESDNLHFQNFLTESAGSLEMSVDNGISWTSIDNKVMSIVDNAAPTITARETADLNGDGILDAIHITFSKNINDSTIVATNFDVAGGAVTTESFSSTTNGDTANDNDIYITFADGGLSTSALPTLKYSRPPGNVTDMSGNFLPNDAAAVACTDRAGPAITNAPASDAVTVLVGIDNDDTVTLTFSENTNKPPISNANINTVLALNNTHTWLDGGGNIGSVLWNGPGNILTVTLSVGGGAPTVAVGDTITLNGTTITDGTNNSTTVAFSSITGTFSSDTTPPSISTITTADTNGNGFIDRLIVTFSENVASGTIVPGNFSVSAGTIASVADDGAPNNAIIWVNINDGVLDTAQIPTLTISPNGIRDLPGNGNNNIAAFASTDGAGPAITSALASDAVTILVGIDNDDTVTLTFSENTNKPVITNANINTVLTLNNTHTWLDGAGNIGDAAWNLAGNILTVTLSVGGGLPTVAVGDTITLNGTTITDGTNNSSTTAFSSITGTFSSDTTPPSISTITTADTNGNGFIDRLIVTFGENVASGTIVPGNYSVSAGTIASVVDDGAPNNAVIRVNLNDGVLDTAQIPTLTISPNGIRDLAGNGNNNIAAFASTDGALPVILSAVSYPGSTTLTVTFSEPVDTSNAGVGNLVTTDFAYANVSGSGASSIISMGADADGTDRVVTLTVNTGFSAGDFGVDTINAVLNQIFDLSPQNNPCSTSSVTLTNSGAVPPVIIETRAVVGSNQIYIEFNMNVYTDLALNPIVNTDFNYDSTASGSGLTITNVQPFGGSLSKYIFSLNGALTDEYIVSDRINALNNEVYNGTGTAMVSAPAYPVSSIGINFFLNTALGAAAISDNSAKIEVFDGSKKSSSIEIKVTATVDVNSSGYRTTPKLYYDIFNDTGSASFWSPSSRSSSRSISGKNIGGIKWEFTIPEDTKKMTTGKILSFVFEINGLFCYRAPRPVSDPSFSPYDAASHMVEFKSISLQNNNVTILNNVINPANGETTKLLYFLDKSGPVSIAVYDLNSDLVKVLKAETQNKGTYTIEWDGKNSNGKKVARGVYFIRVRAPGIFNQIRKVLVIK